MSQSLSLTAALEAVERVFCAKTGNLIELANIAGVAPEILFLRADLSGLDLRDQDISFLLPLETNYHAAMLTGQQRLAFKKSKQQIQRRLRKKIRDLRVEIVARFIDEFEVDGHFRATTDVKPRMSASELKGILLNPLIEQTKHNRTLTPKYMNGVLNKLDRFKHATLFTFIEDVFKLLGEIQCPVDKETAALLESDLAVETNEAVGSFIGNFRATEVLDSSYIMLNQVNPEYFLIRALVLARHRKVHVGAIEAALRVKGVWTFHGVLQLLSEIPFDCDSDQAERLATYLTLGKWPANRTREVLEAKTQPKVRNAVFRQLLAQGKQERVVEVVKWLDGNRGAAGALSLENAFIHIKNFDLAYQLAYDIAPRLAENQIGVIETALSSLALGQKDAERLASFRRQYVRRKPSQQQKR